MDKYDPSKQIGLIVDEWSNWFNVDREQTRKRCYNADKTEFSFSNRQKDYRKKLEQL